MYHKNVFKVANINILKRNLSSSPSFSTKPTLQILPWLKVWFEFSFFFKEKVTFIECLQGGAAAGWGGAVVVAVLHGCQKHPSSLSLALAVVETLGPKYLGLQNLRTIL